jgi:hypothetical protein
MSTSNFVYFGPRFAAETDGAWGYIVEETRNLQATWEDVIAAVVTGQNVHVRPADAGEMACAEANLVFEKLNRGTQVPDQTMTFERQHNG